MAYIDVAPHNMTSNTAPSPYIAAASSELGTGQQAYKAFDNAVGVNQYWSTSVGGSVGWLRIYLGSSKTPVRYAVRFYGVGTPDPNRAPKDWTFEGSNDASSWTTLDTQTGQTGWTGGETRTFNFTNTNSYTYFRVNVSANNGATTTVIGELYIYENVVTQQTINSNITFKQADIQNNILSDIKFILQQVQEDIDSDITFKRIEQQNLNSDTYFKVLDNQQTINSDIYFSQSIQEEIDSDITFKRIEQQNLNSDTYFKVLDNQQQINSDIIFKIVTQEDIDSDITFKRVNANNLLSNITFASPYLSKFIYNDKLYIVTDTNPAKLIEVIISASPTWTIYTLNVGGETYTNGKDLVINYLLDKLYITFANGKVAEVKLSNLNTRIEKNVVETNQLLSIDSRKDFNYVFIGSNEASAELFTLDGTTKGKVNTRFDFLKQNILNFKFIVNYLQGKQVNTRFDFLKLTKNQIKSKFAYQKEQFADETLISREDFEVYIDGVPTSDVRLDSIKIVHVADNNSTASFELARKHDRINQDEDDNTSIITENNGIIIYINEVLAFEGKIDSLDCAGDQESISVTAKGEQWKDNRNLIELPLALNTEHRNLYHILVDRIFINKPDLSEYIANEFFTAKILLIENKTITSVERLRNEVISSVVGWSFIQPNILNVPNCYSGDIIIYTYSDGTFARYKVIQEDSFIAPYYKGIKIDLGQKTIEQHSKWKSSFDTFEYSLYTGAGSIGQLNKEEQLAFLVNEGIFEPKDGWTYFWFADFTNIVTQEQFENWYIGTDISKLLNDSYYISRLSYIRQKLNTATGVGYNIDSSTIFGYEQGYYYLGEAPYKEVSSQAGWHVSQKYYEDRENGLFVVKNSEYKYNDYVKQVAAIEYKKLKNINDEVLPATSASISLTIDAYLYYNLALLSRVNIINTTIDNVYKNNNGFPLAIKQITIDSSAMQVQINVDNQQSGLELEELTSEILDTLISMTPKVAVLSKDKFNE